MSKYNTKLHREIPAYVPQRTTESRFARDYRAQQAHAPRVAKGAMLVGLLKDAAEVACMAFLAVAVWYVFAVVTP